MGDIKRQSVNNTILSYIGALVGFLSLIYIQPYFLGSKNIGLLRLIYSYSWVIAMLIPLGMSNVTMRFFPKIRDSKNVHNGYFGLLTLTVTAGALILLLLFFVFKGRFESYYTAVPEFIPYYFYCFAFAYVFALISVYNIYSSSLMRTTFTVFLTDVYSRLAFIVLIFMYYYGLIGEYGLVVGYILIYFIQLLLLVMYLAKLGAVSFNIHWDFYKSFKRNEILLFILIMTISSFASLAIKYIDGLMLGHYVDDIKLIGVYSVCAFIPTILEIPYNSLERIAQPKMAVAWHEGNTSEIKKIYEMSSRYMFFIGGSLFCVIFACSDLIFMILPPEYSEGRNVFIILMVSSLFNLLTGVNTTLISVSEKYFVISLMLVLLVVLGITLNTFTIPVFGINGAALAALLSIGFYNLLKYLYILTRFKMQPFTIKSLYISLCIVLSMLFIWFMPAALNPYVKAILGCLVTGGIFIFASLKFRIIDEVNTVLKKLTKGYLA